MPGLIDVLRRERMFQNTPGGAAIGYPNISGLGMLFSQMGQERRQPYPSENEYFKANPSVAGMATEDNRVTLNPYSNLSMREKQSVMVNEALRLLIGNKPIQAGLTPEQDAMLANTSYANAPEQARRATILARIFSGDKSAGEASSEQVGLISQLLKR